MSVAGRGRGGSRRRPGILPQPEYRLVSQHTRKSPGYRYEHRLAGAGVYQRGRGFDLRIFWTHPGDSLIAAATGRRDERRRAWIDRQPRTLRVAERAGRVANRGFARPFVRRALVGSEFLELDHVLSRLPPGRPVRHLRQFW